MGGESIRRQPRGVRLALTPRAFSYTVAGLVLDAATVIVCALNAVSVQQAIAMALPAALATAVGLTGLLVPDPWAAWRRGFQHGCATAARCDACQGALDVSAKRPPHLVELLARAHVPERRRALSGRGSGSRGTAAYALSGGQWESVGVHVLNPEQREHLRDRCTGRVGDPPDRGHGRGLPRQAFRSEEGVNHLIAVTALPHPDEHPASEALT
jgi:hypothetical protein